MGHGPVKVDPAIERFNNMRESAYLHFRWTRRTARTAVLGFIVFPAAVYYLADYGFLRWDFTARRKDQLLTVTKPSSED